MTECFKFGSYDGCKTTCPVFSCGGCKLEDSDAIFEMIKNDDDLSEEDMKDIGKLYPVLYPIINKCIRKLKLDKLNEIKC
jgi:hypothetical protein